MAEKVLLQGESSSPNDLVIKFTKVENGQKVFVSPYSVHYTLVDSTTGQDLIIGRPFKIPQKVSEGVFFAPWTVPLDEPSGAHRVKWTFKETADGAVQSVFTEFTVKAIQRCEVPEFGDCMNELIREMRLLLRDDNPDRDYHFQPPTAEKEIAGFTQIRGHRWPDDHLAEFILLGLDEVNGGAQPATVFELDELCGNDPTIKRWKPLVFMFARSHAFESLASLWINEEFEYSLNGISLTISRYDKYSSVANQLYSSASERLIEQKKTVKILRGLAQSRFTFSRGAALGPWTGGSGNLRRWFVGSGQHSGFRPGTLRAGHAF